MDSTDELLMRVRTASEDLDLAKKEYKVAVFLASSRGHSNVQIARAARKTEAAIRMYLKREIERRR